MWSGAKSDATRTVTDRDLKSSGQQLRFSKYRNDRDIELAAGCGDYSRLWFYGYRGYNRSV